ncbi:hypothetical protein PMAYCL1PPCAC_02696, partial [Pristionchus mayeri]
PEKEGVIVTSDDELPEGLKLKKEVTEDKAVKEELLPISPCTSEECDEPQMNTPEDPVIHSPPSLRAPVLGSPTSIAAALHNSPLNQGYGQSPTGCDGENRTSCESPGSAGEATDADGRRRQKTCRVCGDHATGYNFNVITCESCKAFFRRNALRPKEFKCPYSEDCDINSVSRRFCQKCRLRKCFSVGMKKEWILNEEQLRRRKNSRLNNMANQQRVRDQTRAPFQNPNDPQMKNLSSPVSVLTSPTMALHSPPSRHGGLSMPPIVSPPSVGGSAFSLLSPTDSSNSDSPPGAQRGGPLGVHHSSSIDGYDHALLMQQRQLAHRLAQTGIGSPQSMLQAAGLSQGAAAANRGVSIDPLRGRVMMSIDEYQSLMQMAAKPAAVSPLGMNGDQGSPDYKPNVFSPPMNISPFNGGSNGMAEMGGHIKHELDERLKTYLDGAINDELNSSPDLQMVFANGTGNGTKKEGEELNAGEKLSYQLNTAELRALDAVREAFSGMNETLDGGKQRDSFMKSSKTPTDIMNIMDVTMRRLVKMSKKLPTFNELSNEGKFALLKGGMVEMLTIRGVTRYDTKSNSWKTPVVPDQYTVPVSMFDSLNSENKEDMKNRFLQFVASLHEDFRKNELAISLMMLIVLFTQRENVNNPTDQRLIDKHNRDYSHLLFRYMESLYGDDARKFQDVLPKALEILHLISDQSITLFMGTVKSEEAEPLPREFFKTD